MQNKEAKSLVKGGSVALVAFGGNSLIKAGYKGTRLKSKEKLLIRCAAN